MVFSTKDFAYDAQMMVFSQEYSTLQRGVEQRVFRRILHLPPQDGLTLSSAKTGVEIDFVIVRKETDAEGELLAWHLAPSYQERLSNPNLEGVRMVIFND